jgi:hypothetical protein
VVVVEGLPPQPVEETVSSDEAVPGNPPAEQAGNDIVEQSPSDIAANDSQPSSPDIDLQIEYVQALESGDAENALGPLYRVWIVNNGGSEISQPFDVVLVATNDDSPSPESPYAAERVAKIGAGQRLSVEIRLPVEVLQLSVDAEGMPVPFKNLFAAADVEQELKELNEENNALGLARHDIPDASLLATVN